VSKTVFLKEQRCSLFSFQNFCQFDLYR